MAALWSPASVAAPNDTISQLRFGPNDLLAVASWDGTVQVSNMKGDWSTRWATSRPQFAICWSAYSGRVFFGGAERRVSVIDCEKDQRFDLFATASFVTSVAESTNLLVVGTEQGVSLFDPRSTRVVDEVDPNTCVCDVALNAVGTYIVTAGLDGFCRLYDSRYLKSCLVCRNPFHCDSQLLRVEMNSVANAYAVSNNESHVAIEYINTPEDSFVFKSNRIVSEFGTRSFPIYDLGFDSDELATAGGDKSVYIWDFRRKRLKEKISFSMPCMSFAYSRQGRYCAVGLSGDEWRTTPAKFNTTSQAKVLLRVNNCSQR